MTQDGYFVKVVPARGNTIYRFAFHPRHVYALLALALAFVAGALLFHYFEIHQARSQLSELQRLTAVQKAQLEAIDRQAQGIQAQLHRVQEQDQQIRRLMGVDAHKMPQPTNRRQVESRHTYDEHFSPVVRKLQRLARASDASSLEAAGLQQLAFRILNVRHMRSVAEERIAAAIPSINPVGSGAIVGCFCFRTFPTVEFHQGVDLDANYGDTVRAAASGIVVAADYDGGYGIKVDIDHGNGFHTWYAHLERAQVHPGEEVAKGEPIGLAGATGHATGPHLHYQIMRDGKPIDPTPYLSGVPPKVLASLP